jgi:pilus assembly protein CpaD
MRFSPHAGDRVQIASGGGPNALTAQRAEVVAAQLHRLAPTAELAAGIADIDENAIGVSIGRYLAAAPNCPDWTDADPQGFDNAPSSNFGCATQSDLAAMVANPEDLLRGKAAGPADGDFVARSVERYRSGELFKPTEQSATQVGTPAGTNAPGETK